MEILLYRKVTFAVGEGRMISEEITTANGAEKIDLKKDFRCFC